MENLYQPKTDVKKKTKKKRKQTNRINIIYKKTYKRNKIQTQNKYQKHKKEMML